MARCDDGEVPVAPHAAPCSGALGTHPNRPEPAYSGI